MDERRAGRACRVGRNVGRSHFGVNAFFKGLLGTVKSKRLMDKLSNPMTVQDCRDEHGMANGHPKCIREQRATGRNNAESFFLDVTTCVNHEFRDYRSASMRSV